MILFSGHKEFTYRGNEYEFIGDISIDSEDYYYKDGEVNRIEYDEDSDCEIRIPHNGFSAGDLVEFLNLDISDILEDLKHVEFNYNE
jgi:hypothetical protein